MVIAYFPSVFRGYKRNLVADVSFVQLVTEFGMGLGVESLFQQRDHEHSHCYCRRCCRDYRKREDGEEAHCHRRLVPRS